MRAHFVDDLLARLEGSVSPIWITVAALTDVEPDVAALRRAFETLFTQTPRLSMAWRDGGWKRWRWTGPELRAAVTHDGEPQPLDALIRALASEPATLDRAPAMRLHVGPVVVEGETLWAVVARMHHAMGDARALGATLARLWPGVRGDRIPLDDSPPVLMRDRDVLRWAATHWRAAAGLLTPAKRLLAKRAVAMRRDGDQVGRPIAWSVALQDLGATGSREHAEIFLAGTLAVAAAHSDAAHGVLRLRMPIDLSGEMGWRGVLGNTCMAIPLEFDLSGVRARSGDGAAMRTLVRAEIAEALAEARPVTTAIECLITSRLAPTETLRRGAAPGLLTNVRTNTLVATYVGKLDPYFAEAPFPIRGMASHTSTWGAHAWSFDERLVVNATAFEGLWRRDTVRGFAEDVADWIEGRGLGRRCAGGVAWGVA